MPVTVNNKTMLDVLIIRDNHIRIFSDWFGFLLHLAQPFFENDLYDLFHAVDIYRMHS